MIPPSTHRPETPVPPVLLNIVSAAHLICLAVFGTVLALATNEARAEEIVCAGENLMPSIAKEHPESMAAIEEAEDAVVNGKGIFWRIEKSGIEPSWLLGTMHVTDPRVTELGEAARSAFDGSATVVVEIKDIGDDPQKLAAALFASPGLTSLEEGQMLQDLLDDEEEDVLKAALKRRNVPLVTVSRMKPWLIMSMLTTRDCELQRKQAGQSFLDMQLARNAVENGKDLVGLETLEEQFEAMNSLPMDTQIDMLVTTASLEDELYDMFETMTALYAEGRVAAIMPMLKEVAHLYGLPDEEEQAALFEENLIETRNRTMAERLVPVLDKGNAFVAVGALHLPGEDGLVALLRDAGFKLTPME